MHAAFAGLGVGLPVIGAPMAGGPSTPELAAAVARAGGLCFLAAGYKTPQQMAAEIATIRGSTAAFGVNLFAPNPVPVDSSEFTRYAKEIEPIAERFGVVIDTAEPIEDDDGWPDKVDVLTSDPVPVVSFTFGIPDRVTIARLRRAGSVVIQTVTSVAEARSADPTRGDPVLTRAFTGRPARGLPNEFIRRYDALAPIGYPAIHHLTSALRRAATAAGDPEWVNLWAGTGYRAATAEPAETIIRRLFTGDGDV